MRILIADDHPLTLMGTKNYIESLGYKNIITCTNGNAALNSVQISKPDIAILDINMPGLDGLDIAQFVFEKKLHTKVILLTMHKEMTLYKKAEEYNIFGYILKDRAFSELENCINSVIIGKKFKSNFINEDLIKDNYNPNDQLLKLTVSERKILELIAKQKTSKQIAELLFLSEKTIEGHRSNIIQKLGIPKEKNALLKWAIQNII
ncbi:MAG: response regulator transcription factor [Limnohabitans sp.]|nr:response regulator transcription factor [Limnohabitans sp.]